VGTVLAAIDHGDETWAIDRRGALEMALPYDAFERRRDPRRARRTERR